MASPSILFRCDASPEIGGGHVMRCLTLANALAARGCAVRFACASGSAQAVWALGASGYARLDLDDPFDPAEVEAKAGAGHHTIVVDHYGLGQAYERRLRRLGERVLVIDDLVDRAHDCDILVDQSLGRSRHAYRELIPPQAVALTGSTYAMVRPEFAKARAVALARHRVACPGQRILISLGLTDVGGISEQVTRALLARRPDLDIDVALGASAPSRAGLETLATENARLRLHVDTTHIAELMSAADLAIGAGGTTSWERCCLGLPTVLLVLACNQMEVGRSLEACGAVALATDAASAAATADAVLASPDARARMAASTAAIIDGRGTERIVDHLLQLSPERPRLSRFSVAAAVRRDAETIWLWRNDPQTRAVSLTSAPVLWESHVGWLDRTLADARTMQLMVSCDGMAVGTVRFACLDDHAAALVSINLDPAMRGRGIGRAVLACAIEHHESAPLAAALVADIALDNRGSVAIFEACGFRPMSLPDESRFTRYRRSLTTNAG